MHKRAELQYTPKGLVVTCVGRPDFCAYFFGAAEVAELLTSSTRMEEGENGPNNNNSCKSQEEKQLLFL